MAVLAIVGGAYIRINTLFLIALAAFLCGTASERCGMPYGCSSLVAAFLLALILSPEKLQCMTFLGTGIYVQICEWLALRRRQDKAPGRVAAWIIRMAAWIVFLIAALVLYQLLVGNVTEVIREALPFEAASVPAMLIFSAAALAAGVLLAYAYESFLILLRRRVFREDFEGRDPRE